MNITDQTPRVARSIGGTNEANAEVRVSVQVPQPFVAGAHTLTEGEANALNQIVAENLSNNLRAKIVQGRNVAAEGQPDQFEPYDETTAQALVDAYLAEYELGVRRAGSGERQVTDPVEREARKIAREKAKQVVKDAGGKPSDYDLGPIADKIFEANKDTLMREGKKIVDAAAKVSGGLSLEGIELTPKAAAAATAPAEGEADAGEGGAVEETATA